MEGLNLLAVPADPASIQNMFKWLCGDEVSINKPSLTQELGAKFLNHLNKMGIPNGTVDHLTDFIQSRTWDESHVWGGTMAEFWKIVKATEDEREKWSILCVFIDSNMSWQSRLSFFSIDAFHRGGAGNIAFNDSHLPGSEKKSQEAVSEYAKKLEPVSETYFTLCVQTESGSLTLIEHSIKLGTAS